MGLADEVIASAIDLTEAEKMLEQRTKSVVQQINYNKALVAMHRQSGEPREPKQVTPEPEPINKLENLFGALTRQKGK